MKPASPHSLILALVLAFISTPTPAEETPAVELVEVFAKAEGDNVKIYIWANGNISSYKTSRALSSDTYKLTLHVPALPPVDSKYDLSIPFSHGFRVWPVKLGDRIYTRITIELDMEVSTEVGLDGPSKIFVSISRKSPIAFVDAGLGTQDEGGEVAEPVVSNAVVRSP